MTSTPESAAPPPVHTERRKRVKGWQSRDALRVAGLILLLYYGSRLLWVARPVLIVGFLGLLFGLAVSSGVDRLQGFGIRRGIGAPLIVVSFLALLFGLGEWMAPTLREQNHELRKKLPEAVDRAELWVNNRQGGIFGLMLGAPDSAAVGDSVAARTPAETLKGKIGKSMGGMSRHLFPFLSSAAEVFAGVLIILFMSIYIAVDPGMYHRGILQLVPRKSRARAGEVLSAIATVLRRWLETQLIAMATIGAITTAFLLVLHVKAAFALGLLAGLLEFIPTFGSIMSALPAIAMGFVDSPQKAVYVAIAGIVVHFIENHLLIPLLMKGRVNVPPALTVLSQAVLLLLFGFLGMMIAVPLLAATMVAVRMLYVQDVLGERGSVEENLLGTPPVKR